MGQFVDDNEVRLSRQYRIDVEFRDIPAAIGLHAPRQDLQTAEKGFRLLPAVGFRHPNDDVDAFFPLLSSCPEHRIGFAYSRGGTEEYLELTLSLTFLVGGSPVEEFVGIWSFHFHGCDIPERLGLTALLSL